MDGFDLQRLDRLGDDPVLVAGLLRLLIQQIPSGLLVLDAASGEPMLANRQMAAIWGMSPTDEPFAPDWRGYHLDGSPMRRGEWPHERVLAGESAEEPEEIENVRSDGTRGLVRLSAVPLKAGAGEPLAVLITCQDVSESHRRLTSRRFLNDAGRLLASSLDYVSTLRNLARLAVPTLADWCTVDLLNARGELSRVAVEHVDERLARAAAELARRHPPSIDTDIGAARVVREGRSELIPDVTPELLGEFASSPGHRKLLEELGVRSVMFVPLIARGRTLGAMGFVAAESMRRYTEEDLEVAEELASRAALAIENSRLFDESLAANEAKSDFLAVMSHELRTPLTAIIGYSELLQLGVPEPVTRRQAEQAERIEVSARHLLQLIEEILTLVTLDSGEDRIRHHEVAVNELLDRAAAIIEPMARAKQLPLSVQHAPDHPVIESDPDKLLQILLNLLSNAVKFTQEGEIDLTARIEEDRCVFVIRDTGIGLDVEHMQRIFEPFWQVERPITRKAGGTGLGLTIARRLAEMMRGEIRVDSRPGHGSSFEVHVPLGHEELAPEPVDGISPA